MKKIVFSCFFLCFCNQIFSQLLFEKGNIVDEFGDNIGETLINNSNGFFSNSVTNNSPLKVKTVLNLTKKITLDEHKEMLKKEFIKQNFSEKDIKLVLKSLDENYKQSQNFIGSIIFELNEYENLKANFISGKTGVLSIKTEDNKKLSCSLFANNIQNNNISISGYKEITKGSAGVENQIKYGYYDWSQTDVFNEILNAKVEIQIVISIDNSTYKFVLKNKS
jgi:hypothetical protein